MVHESKNVGETNIRAYCLCTYTVRYKSLAVRLMKVKTSLNAMSIGLSYP